MNENNKKNSIFKKIKNYFLENLRNILIVSGVFLIILISFQFYNYFLMQELKKNSVKFFNTIQQNDDLLDNLNTLKKGNDFYSTLSTLKLIQKNNDENKFDISNQLYKEIISSSKLDNLYKSSISVHASYTFINASYIENTTNYLDNISFYISNISDDLESFFSIKKELQYLIVVLEIDLNNSNYINNTKAIELYEEIFESNLVSSSVKERVKKIHEFQLYK